ncbi:MAG: YolD-like family protein [Bacilli bacterium]
MRGMKKWLPFKSLNGQYEALGKMVNDRNKSDKPVLSVDEEEDINRSISSLTKGSVCTVTFYEDGKILSWTSKFLHCDEITKKIVFQDFTLCLSDLLGIQTSRDYW